MSPTTKIFGVPRHDERWFGQHASGAIERHAERRGDGRSGDPSRPQHGLGRQPDCAGPSGPLAELPVDRQLTPSSSTLVTIDPVCTSTPSRSSDRRAASRKRSGNAPSTCGLPSISTMRADSGRMFRKSCFSDCRAISASAPASSTPVGPPPTMTNVSRRRWTAGSVSRSAASNASSTCLLISSASSSVLRPGARAGPLGMPEVGVGRSGGDDQVVVRDGAARIDEHATSRDVHGMRAREQDPDVLLTAQDPPDGRRDVGGRQRRGRDLIEQGLEEVIVVAIDQRDPHRRAGQRARGVQTAKPSAQDDDVWIRGHDVTHLTPRVPRQRLATSSGLISADARRLRGSSVDRVTVNPWLHQEKAERRSREPELGGPASIVETACPLDCPDACSLAVTVQHGKVIEIDGSHKNPVTERLHLREGAEVRRARLRPRSPALSGGPQRAEGRRQIQAGHVGRSARADCRADARGQSQMGRRIDPAVFVRRLERPAHAGQSRRQALAAIGNVAARAHVVRGADRRGQSGACTARCLRLRIRTIRKPG